MLTPTNSPISLLWIIMLEMLKIGSTRERPREGAAGRSRPGRVKMAAVAAGVERSGTSTLG